MDERREHLRRILAATGASGRLTDEQREEIIGHLEDSVEEKVRAGTAEMEAVAQAFEAMGDLRKIADQFPGKSSAAVTADGPRVGWKRYGPMIEGYGLMIFFGFFLTIIMPRVGDIFRSYGVKVPGPTLWFWNLGQAMTQYWPVSLGTAIAVGLCLFGFARHRHARTASLALIVMSLLLLIGALVCACLPFLSLQQGIR